MHAVVAPYSWGDVADAITSASRSISAPSGLIKVEVYWDQVTLFTDSTASKTKIQEWLDHIFPRRMSEDAILLDGPAFSQKLPIEYVSYDAESDGAPPPKAPAQFVAASSRVWLQQADATSTQNENGLPTFAFHSVKGGVGRTTSAISFAKSLVDQHGLRPLLVDADFEAPGISYLFLNDGRQSLFSLEDLIVLAHADEQKSATDTVNFGASKLSNQTHDGITVLPCLRTREKLSAFAIRPEQLQKSHDDQPFFLLSLLKELAQQAGCDCMIIDLRAGFTDLAAMTLCAPGVATIFVTTPSGQAVESTRQMLDFISTELRDTSSALNRPAIIVNNVIPQVRRSAEFTALLLSLEESANQFIRDDDADSQAGVPIDLFGEDVKGSPIVALDHAPTLTAAPSGLADFLDDLRGQACFDQLGSGLYAWAKDYIASCASIEAAESEAAEPPSVAVIGLGLGDDIKAARKSLATFAEERIFAESANQNSSDFMMVRSLAELSERFKTELPNATCIGMKGAGKTFTFRLLAEHETWGSFLSRARGLYTARAGEDNNLILPVLPARNLQQSPRMESLRKTVSSRVGGEQPIAFSDLNAAIDRASVSLATESAWSQFWLDVIAWSSGLLPGEPGAGSLLVEFIQENDVRVVALFDGLEEAFQQFRNDANQQAAIRGLTSSLSQMLLEIPRRPLGVINFVRSDLVSAAYPNNFRQFADRNKGFALTWYDRDILELAAWLANRAAAFREDGHHAEADREGLSLEAQLELLWGQKLGKPDRLSKGGRTREARSSEWVIAALSDLRGRISARDLVGFVAYSAERSITEETSSLSDRLLLPRAMSSAIGPVGNRKIEAMGEENPSLKVILEKLRQAPQFAVPLNLGEFVEKIPGLDPENLKMLEDNGVILIENDSVEMPEIFRTGLGNVVRAKGGRKSIIGLMNRAKLLKTGDDVL